MIKLSSALLCLVLFSCTPKVVANRDTTDATENSSAYIAKAYEVFGLSAVTFEKNSDGQFVLATYKEESQVPEAAALHIAVIKVQTNELVFKKSLMNGSAKWKGDYIVEIVSPPGIPKSDQETLQDYTYSIDVKTGEKLKSLNVKVTD